MCCYSATSSAWNVPVPSLFPGPLTCSGVRTYIPPCQPAHGWCLQNHVTMMQHEAWLKTHLHFKPTLLYFICLPGVFPHQRRNLYFDTQKSACMVAQLFKLQRHASLIKLCRITTVFYEHKRSQISRVCKEKLFPWYIFSRIKLIPE